MGINIPEIGARVPGVEIFVLVSVCEGPFGAGNALASSSEGIGGAGGALPVESFPGGAGAAPFPFPSAGFSESSSLRPAGEDPPFLSPGVPFLAVTEVPEIGTDPVPGTSPFGAALPVDPGPGDPIGGSEELHAGEKFAPFSPEHSDPWEEEGG